MPDTSVCRCGQRQLWTITEGAARMPVNDKPDPAGNVATWTDPGSGVTYSRVITRARPLLPTETQHMPHHATCPYADRFRAPKPVKPKPTDPPALF